MTLKKIILTILQIKSETRDSDKKLIWEVLRYKGLTAFDQLSFDNFMSSPSFEAVRRCRQSLQRSDRLLGKWSIQPSKEVEKHRKELASLKGYNFIEGQSTFI